MVVGWCWLVAGLSIVDEVGGVDNFGGLDCLDELDDVGGIVRS